MVCISAAAVRLAFPSVFIFKEDEARALEYALRIARDHASFTHTWPSSVGIANSPVFVYLIAPFAAISHSPQFVSLCMNLLNLASIGVAYAFFMRAFQNGREARLSALFYAISPMAVHYSRKIWDPVPAPLLAAVLMYAALRVLERDRSRWIFPLLLGASLTAQLHQSGIFFVFLLMLAVAVHRPRLNAGWTAAGCVAAAAVAAPYLAYLCTHGLGGASMVGHGLFSRLPDIDVVTNFLLDCTGHNIFAVAGYDSVPFLNWPLPGFGALVGLMMLLFLPVLCLGGRELARRSSLRVTRRPPFVRAGNASGYNLLLVCLFGQPLLYLLFRVPGVAHYFLVLFPVLFCLIPLGISRMERGGGGGRLARCAWILPLLWIGISVSFTSMTAFRMGGYSYGPLYRYQQRIAGEVVGLREKLYDRPGVAPARTFAEADTVALSIHAPRSRTGVPEQWRFVFREMYGYEPVEPETAPYFRVTLSWERSPWRRGTHRIERIDAFNSD